MSKQVLMSTIIDASYAEIFEVNLPMKISLDSADSVQNYKFEVSNHFYGTFSNLFPLKYEINQVYDTNSSQLIYNFDNIFTLNSETG